MAPTADEVKITAMPTFLMQVEAGGMSVRRAEERFNPALIESAEHEHKFIRRHGDHFKLTPAGRKELGRR